MGIILLIFAVIFGPPLLLLSIGLSKRKTSPDSAKACYIIAVVYLIIAGGICASILVNIKL